MTYTSLAMLRILGDSFGRVNRANIAAFLRELQLPDGRFVDHDLNFHTIGFLTHAHFVALCVLHPDRRLTCGLRTVLVLSARSSTIGVEWTKIGWSNSSCHLRFVIIVLCSFVMYLTGATAI
jgi:hypothetical protein